MLLTNVTRIFEQVNTRVSLARDSMGSLGESLDEGYLSDKYYVYHSYLRIK